MLLMEAFGPSHFSPPDHNSNPSLGGYQRLAVIPPGPEDHNRLHLRRNACCLTHTGLGGLENWYDDRAWLPTLGCLYCGLSSLWLPSLPQGVTVSNSFS